jgi:hypothetical protein
MESLTRAPTELQATIVAMKSKGHHLEFIPLPTLDVKINSIFLVYFIKLSRYGEIAIVSECVRAFKSSVRR